MTYREQFIDGQSWGISAAIDLHDCNPKLVRSEKDIKKFVYELCNLIDVKRFGDCVVVNFGEDERVAGYSMTQLIETSLISGHFVNTTNNIYLDVFSCRYFDPEVVAKKAQDFFAAKSANLAVAIRK